MSEPAINSPHTINLNFGGAKIPFTFPYSKMFHQNLAGIFSGIEYPLPPLQGWKPDLIVDAGANVGAVAMFFGLSYPAARVICYEPSPTNVSYLRRNLAERPHIEAFDFGLHDHDETVALFVGQENSMQNSVIQTAETSAASERVHLRRASDEFRQRGVGEASSVMLKIDTEGCEIPILRDLDAASQLANVDVMYVEYHSESDRMGIEEMLVRSGRFMLARAAARIPHRGTNQYFSRRLVDRYPAIDALQIVRPPGNSPNIPMMRFLAILLLCVFALPASARGWGSDGHKIIALIAESRLTDKAKSGVAELLDKDTLADVASWADTIRKDREETSTWHYVDIPYDMQAFDRVRDGKNGNNVIEKIVDFANILNDRRRPRTERVEALKFLVHFIGDIHQPLHCAERNEDKGGNFRLVFFLEQPEAVNLHRVWDSVILRRLMNPPGREKPDVKVYAETLAAGITEKQAKQWMGGDPEKWANEAHRLAVQVAYADIPADGAPPKITEAYLERADPVLNEQLCRGGVRLAEVLNKVFR